MAKEHKVVVFEWVHCPYCVRAHDILKPLCQDIKYYQVENMPNGEQLRKQIYDLYKHETVPAIFINGKFVGGCDDLQKAQSSGELSKMLSA